MTSIRQNKVSRLIQKELGALFQKDAGGFLKGAMVSVTAVRMSPDLGLAKAYISIFAPGDKKDYLELIRSHAGELRFLLGKKVKNQLRIVPELAFFIDDSLDYAERINQLLKS